MPELSTPLRLHGGTKSASGARVKADKPRQRWRESASLDARVRPRHPQTSLIELDSQDSRSRRAISSALNVEAMHCFHAGSR